jgi:hypothetical protein
MLGRPFLFGAPLDTLTAIATYKRTGVKLTPHACRQQHARLAVEEVRMPAGATLPPREEKPRPDRAERGCRGAGEGLGAFASERRVRLLINRQDKPSRQCGEGFDRVMPIEFVADDRADIEHVRHRVVDQDQGGEIHESLRRCRRGRILREPFLRERFVTL